MAQKLPLWEFTVILAYNQGGINYKLPGSLPQMAQVLTHWFVRRCPSGKATISPSSVLLLAAAICGNLPVNFWLNLHRTPLRGHFRSRAETAEWADSPASGLYRFLMRT